MKKKARTLLTSVFPDSSDVRFNVNKDESGKVQGFTLKGIGNTDAEAYCLSFITAQSKGKADITFEKGKIVFHHGGIGTEERDSKFGVWGVSEGGKFYADITEEDAKELSQLLECQGEYKTFKPHVRIELAWSKGFTLYIKQS